MDVLPSDMNLAGAEIEFQEIENKETLLKRYLDQVRDDYDFILTRLSAIFEYPDN